MSPADTRQVNPAIDAVNQANARVMNLYERWVRGRGLPYHQFLVLYALVEGGSLPQKELAERTHLSKQTVSNLVAALEREGYAERQGSPDSGREKLVALTDAGERFAHATIDELLDVEERVVRRVGTERMTQLANLATAFGDALVAELGV